MAAYFTWTGLDVWGRGLNRGSSRVAGVQVEHDVLQVTAAEWRNVSVHPVGRLTWRTGGERVCGWVVVL